MKYTIDNFLLDVNTGIEVRPWQAARIEVIGKETSHVTRNTVVEFSMDSKINIVMNYYTVDLDLLMVAVVTAEVTSISLIA